MDNTVIIIVDFDNVFQRNIAEYQDTKEIQRRLNQMVSSAFCSIPSAHNISVRLYGGWFQDDTLTPKASVLLSILPSIDIFPIIIDGRKINGVVDLVFRLHNVDYEWHNTYQEKPGLPGVRIARDKTGELCEGSAHLCPVRTLYKFISNKDKICHIEGCLTKHGEVFFHKTQKMVDTMMVCDILSFCRDISIVGIFIASDDIDLFPAVALGRTYNDEIPIMLGIQNIKNEPIYSAILSAFNINVTLYDK